MNKKQFWMMAEPNWSLLGSEGGLPNPEFDKWVKVWCDLESQSVFAQSACSDWMVEMFGEGAVSCEEGQEPDVSSWCMYQWDADGQCWEIECGPEGNHHWWEIDDLLWGVFEECSLWAVDKESHCVKSEMQMVSEIGQMGFVCPEGVAAGALEVWHGREESLLPGG